MPITLQIFYPNGEFKREILQPGGTLSIGTHAENDLIITGSGLAPRHLHFDYKNGKIFVVAFSGLGTPTLNGILLGLNEPEELQDQAVIRLAAYEFRVLVISSRPTPTYYSRTPTISDWGDIPIDEASPEDRPFEIELIGTPPGNPRLVVNPGDTIYLTTNITNTGHRVAKFYIDIEDNQNLVKKWSDAGPDNHITIHPAERSKPLVTSFSPKKEPASRAGTYPFTITVTSPVEYPGFPISHAATLVINPYYQVEIENLKPKKQATRARKPAIFRLTIENNGNDALEFVLEGEDDNDDLFFEFQLLGKSNVVPGRLRFSVEPYTSPGKDDHRVQIFIFASFNARSRLLRLRERRFSIKVAPEQGQRGPEAVSGRLIQKPLIGVIPAVLIVLALLIGAFYFVFHPARYIRKFTVNGGIQPLLVHPQEILTLEWETFPLTTARLSPGDELLLGERSGKREVTPDPDGAPYVLEVSSFVTNFFPEWRATRQIEVTVKAVTPQILQFLASAEEVAPGQEVTLVGQAIDADQMVLTINGTPEPIPVPTAQHANFQTVVHPEQSSTYGLVAANLQAMVTSEVIVLVSTATATLVPAPVVEEFEFSSNQISAGEPLTFRWAVSGDQKVILEPFGQLPPNGVISLSPLDTTVYRLITEDEQGNQTVQGVQQVVVDKPTSTPIPTVAPLAPKIVEFNTSKVDVRILENGNDDDDEGDKVVTLFWTIEGETTDIQLLNKQGVALQTNLPPVFQVDVLASETNDQFILVAMNGELSTRASIALNVTRVKTPQILFFRAQITDPVDGKFDLDPDYNICATTDRNYDDRLECKWKDNNFAVTNTLTIKLSWKVDGSSIVELIPGGNQSAEDELSITLTEDTGFELHADNEFGEDRRKLKICDDQGSC